MFVGIYWRASLLYDTQWSETIYASIILIIVPIRHHAYSTQSGIVVYVSTPTSSSIMEILHEPPSASSFTPLSEHQSRTPSSFYSSRAVLYHHSAATKLIILEHETLASSPLAKLTDAPPTNGAATNGDTYHAMSEEIVVDGVDVWVTSEYEKRSKHLTYPRHPRHDAYTTSAGNSSSTARPSRPESRSPIPASPCTLFRAMSPRLRPGLRRMGSTCSSTPRTASTTTIPPTRSL